MSALDADFAALLDGALDDAAITDFLIRSMDLMHDADALAVGARALQARMIPVEAPPGAIDVCGTGGDGAHTLNISTAVGFVVAGAGVPVAKHGNRAMSSKSGAADVLEALSVRLDADVATLETALRQANIAFLFAQRHHPAMRHVAGPRKALGKRTIFNVLGPLANPAGVRRQLLGVFDAALAEPIARALIALGGERAIAVHGFGGLDELSGEGDNHMIVGRAGHVEAQTVRIVDAGLRPVTNASLRGGDASHNAAALRALLSGDSPNTDYSEIVVFNAAAALLAAGSVSSLHEGAQLARDSLASGAGTRALEALIEITRSAA